jgi:hypothetical protein
MHYAHVKRKEQTMKRITLESYRNNPQLSAELVANARRARAQAVHNLVVGLVQRFTPRLHPGPWIARLG